MPRSCARAVALVLLVLAACGPSTRARDAASPRTAPEASTSTSTSTSTAPQAATTTTRPAVTTSRPPGASTTTTARADPVLGTAGDADQVVVVSADRYGATTAVLTAYERLGDGWRRAFGPWTAHVGTRGLAPPGEKREGDGRTPSGTYGFDFFFGVAADPGVAFPFRRVTSRSIVWDDDPVSPLYNTWVDLDSRAAGDRPEPMYVTPAYDLGAVITYNTARTPGLGSAIFLHVSTGGPTAGCVSLPAGQLIELLKWLDPSRLPRIVIGVAG